MNCKPGDLAVVVSVDIKQKEKNIGLIVKVLRPLWVDEWVIEYANNEYRARDRNLRPIRGDITDKEVEELYSLPKKTEVV